MRQPGHRLSTSPSIRPSLDCTPVARLPASRRRTDISRTPYWSSRSRLTQPADHSGSTSTSTVACNYDVSTMSTESADCRRRPASVHHQRSTPIQSVVPPDRKSRLSTMASWVSRHLLADRAAGHIGRRAIKGMPVPLPNWPSPVVPPRPAPYPPNRKWSTLEPEVGIQPNPDRGEVVVFLPRNSLHQLLPVLRSRCLPP